MGVTKIPVTMRALIARLNRKLADDDLQLKKTRGAQALRDLGTYYLLNTSMASYVTTRLIRSRSHANTASCKTTSG